MMRNVSKKRDSDMNAVMRGILKHCDRGVEEASDR